MNVGVGLYYSMAFARYPTASKKGGQQRYGIALELVNLVTCPMVAESLKNLFILTSFRYPWCT